MPKPRCPSREHGSLTWRILVCLALCAFLLRAAVPAGFMAAPAASHVMLALCDGAGPMRITLEKPGTPANDTHAAAQHCVFGSVAAHAVLPLAGLAPVPGALVAFSVLPLPPQRALPALPAQGPPLGPRAPPALA
ncbi:hypothetical protein CEG14_01575 [Bordetella genomosp. 1]|uniref:DUF2946 domain-containing protein n=1 Tax=Bordetella genomosp. 1 TaxID=1395607 RepID=A0A261SSX3_9BORD|nr:DUF2946 domain-containing protein [Bordetella genomosp. 1]OZI40484.1 hypothetical protein CEG14_01575 [Bordetella genomosp. 1]OZI68677.1 hypothetical protein CAL27_04215 [Bordetella genomosp. 1]